MKNFKEFLREEETLSPGLGKVSLPPPDKQLSPTDEALRRMAVEREAMGLPPATDKVGGNLKDLQRKREQVEYENERKDPTKAIEKLNDIDITQSAQGRINTINQVQQAARSYISDPTVLSLADMPLNWIKGNAQKASKAASERLASNPTYINAQTKKLNQTNEPREN